MMITMMRHTIGQQEQIRLQIPFYECKFTDTLMTREKGVCSYFQDRVATVTVVAPFTPQDALAACQSADLEELMNSMSQSLVDDWSVSICASYVHSFVETERRAALVRQPGTLSSLPEINAALDQIKLGFPTIGEGSVNRFSSEDGDELRSALRRKRTCLTTTMAAKLAGNAGARIGEIGFNLGHSAALLLSALPHASLATFDLCSWPYSKDAFHFLRDEHFGAHRLQLICGDSRETLERYDVTVSGGGAPLPKASTRPENTTAVDIRPPPGKFDAVFIDGGHLYHQAWFDILLMAKLSKPGALVVVDVSKVHQPESARVSAPNFHSLSITFRF
jgi:predicted O-methyltransferase YrrM